MHRPGVPSLPLHFPLQPRLPLPATPGFAPKRSQSKPSPVRQEATPGANLRAPDRGGACRLLPILRKGPQSHEMQAHLIFYMFNKH
ncbi:hypothetical protein ZWY2020_004631 [Hordeum vulgare]|nr:hypothetical protein ZWY2020_004631 [Hordeum vulgare]